ncbi:helix-turn-helix domain-containing protein, partial [Streptomyces purpureus]
MAPHAERTVICPNCRKEFTRPGGRGRPNKYCTPACGAASRRKAAEPPDSSAYTLPVIEIGDDISREAADLVSDVYAELSSAELLDRRAILQRHLDDFEAAVIRRGRARGESWEDLSVALSISPERLRKKWTTDALERRLELRASRTETEATPAFQNALVPGPRTARPAAPSHPAETGAPRLRTGRRTALPPTGQGPQPLARALSHLQRHGHKTVRDIAAYALITPSYVSKILAGTRLPSWPVTERLAEAYEVDAQDLRPLWDAARRQRTPGTMPPHPDHNPARRFHTAIRSLHLAADRPDLWTIRENSDNVLSLATITRVLSGPYVPDWNTTGRLVAALSGRPTDIRPLWQEATAP